MAAANPKLRSTIVENFKLHGLSLRSDATALLAETLSGMTNSEVLHWISQLVESIQKQSLTSTSIRREHVEAAIQECGTTAEEDSNSFLVIDAFSVPRFTYNTDRNKFIPFKGETPGVHGSADDKAQLYRDRYTILHQRSLRHELFMAPVLGGSKTGRFQMQPVEYLLGCTAKIGKVLVLGMLTQLKEGKYFLEDSSGYVELDLTDAVVHTGLFTENCFVLAEGMYDDGVFHISGLGFPPPEAAKYTRSYFGNINFFGGPSMTSCKASAQLLALEKENQDAAFAFLSDVWLDEPEVMSKLRILFTGFAECPPTAFVFCGNFCSSPNGPLYFDTLKDCFKNLADLICEFPPLLESSRFVFVPGPLDPGPGNILPRPALPTFLTADLAARVPFSVFTTNPCRIQYCTQQIIVFREDIVNKMCRNCIRLPSDDVDLPHHLVKTVESQAHLCPLPLHVRPVYWTYDHALRLYPLPDLIVFADKYDPFHINGTTDCISINPGSFSRNGYQFKMYCPTKKEVQNSKIP